MKKTYDVDIVLPCYNPSSNFVEILFKQLQELKNSYPTKSFRYIISNDGSSKNFGPEEKKLLMTLLPDAIVIDNPVNLGKGAAVRAGIAASDAAFTIYSDIDLPYSIDSMCHVIDKTLANYDVVIAIRNQSYYSQLKPLRQIMSRGSQLLNRMVLGTKHTDTQGGLKGLSPRARQIMLRTKINGFLFDTEFVVMAAKTKGIRIINVEATLREEIVMSTMSIRILFRESFNFLRISTRR